MSKQKDLEKSFQKHLSEQELLVKVMEFFPYPIQVFSLDGTAIMMNKASLDIIGIKSKESHLGIYNVFKDPIVIELGCVDKIKQVLAGKTVVLSDFNASYPELIRHFDVVDRDIQLISSDITCFPLFDQASDVEYFAALFIIKKIYKGKNEIGWGKQYIETHWKEPYDAAKAAKAACLSKSHFIKLFKNYTGMTPHDYYINYKINKLKEKLMDESLTISQAFSACNLDYSGYSAKLFKQKTGLSPSDYRKYMKNINEN